MKLSLILLASSLYAATPTFGTLTTVSLSPNSASATVTITGGTSMQIQASVDSSFSITTPWFPVTASSVIFAQLQPNTLYNVRVQACDTAVAAFGASCTGNLGTSGTATVTTKTAIITRTLVRTTGSTTFYNTQYPTRYSDGDTVAMDQLTNGTIVYVSGDGWGQQFTLHDGTTSTVGRNVYLSTMSPDFTTSTLLNAFGTGNGANGVGSEGQANIPGCFSDGASNKASNVLAEGNNFWIAFYRVLGSAVTAVWISKSTDGGSTFTDPSGTNTATAVPPCPGSGVMWTSSTPTMTFLRWLKHTKGGIVVNPVDGTDAYRYLFPRDAAGNNTYLARQFRQFDPAVATGTTSAVNTYEGFTAVSGSDANNPSNWSATLTSMVSQLGPFSDRFDFNVQYLADMGRYEMLGGITIATDDNRIIMYDAPHISGPWTQQYVEPGRTPFNATLNAHADRGWPADFIASYNKTQSAPPCATLNINSYGGFPDNQDRASPANDWYSPSLIASTVCGAVSMFPMPGVILR